MHAKLYLASDHAGFDLKAALSARLSGMGYQVEDVGARTLDLEDDYPDYVLACARKVAEGQNQIREGEGPVFGIIIGASGQGEAMAANRVPGVRAAVYYGAASQSQTDAGGTVLDVIASVRAHNDANILSLGARFLTEAEAMDAVVRFLTTPFSGEARHVRRLAQF